MRHHMFFVTPTPPVHGANEMRQAAHKCANASASRCYAIDFARRFNVFIYAYYLDHTRIIMCVCAVGVRVQHERACVSARTIDATTATAKPRSRTYDSIVCCRPTGVRCAGKSERACLAHNTHTNTEHSVRVSESFHRNRFCTIVCNSRLVSRARTCTENDVNIYGSLSITT